MVVFHLEREADLKVEQKYSIPEILLLLVKAYGTMERHNGLSPTLPEATRIQMKHEER